MVEPESRRAAAAANAAWCGAVARAAGLDPTGSERLWWSPTRTPVGFPDAITLDPTVSAGEAVSMIDSGPDASVKDSFARLDLAPDGFRLLFEAQWIGRSAGPVGSPQLRWSRVSDAEGLRRWCAAYDLDLPAGLATDPAVCVLGGDGGAGFVLNPCADSVGVGCVHSGSLDPDLVWADLIRVAAERFPGRDLLGYEHGRDLEQAVRAGFGRIGPLRIWLRP